MKIQHIIFIADDFHPDRANLVDQNIRMALGLGLKPVLVLNKFGDDILMNCRLLDSCEVAYDGNNNFFSSVQTGIEAIDCPSFIHPLQEPLTKTESLANLERHMNSLGPLPHPDVLRPRNSQAFPQLVTLSGLQHIKKLPFETPWAMTSAMTFVDLEI
jgi:hypothetical protein